MGHPYQSWWCGSDLDIEESRRLVPHQNATTMQVAISVVAACMWMLENPRRGVCVPDDLPHDYILEISKPYLGKFLSLPSDWNPLKHYSNVFRRLQPAPARPVRPVAVQEFPDHRRGLVDEKTLLRLAKTHGTPLVVVDHKVLRENYAQFRKHLPRVQVYYAVKANSAPEIVQTFYEAGASFDVASMAEFLTVHENVKDLPEEQRQALHLGSHHLRQPDQGDRDARAAGSVQAARHLRQPRGSDQDRPARAARRPGAAAARAQHRIDGGALEQVRGARPARPWT